MNVSFLDFQNALKKYLKSGKNWLFQNFRIFQIFQEITTECDIKKLIWPMLFLSAIYLYMFVANFMSQNVMDHNDDIFVTV